MQRKRHIRKIEREFCICKTGWCCAGISTNFLVIDWEFVCIFVLSLARTLGLSHSLSLSLSLSIIALCIKEIFILTMDPYLQCLHIPIPTIDIQRMYIFGGFFMSSCSLSRFRSYFFSCSLSFIHPVYPIFQLFRLCQRQYTIYTFSCSLLVFFGLLPSIILVCLAIANFSGIFLYTLYPSIYLIWYWVWEIVSVWSFVHLIAFYCNTHKHTYIKYNFNLN